MADPAAGGTGDATYAAIVRTAGEIDERVGLLVARLTAESSREEP